MATAGRVTAGRAADRVGIVLDAARQLAVFPVALLVWQALATVVADKTLMPSPTAVFEGLRSMVVRGEIVHDALVTTRRLLLGYGIAAITGGALGILLALNPLARRIMEPGLELLRPIPPLALLPILFALIGVGDGPALAVVFKAALFPVLLNTFGAVNDIERVYREAALTLGARRRDILREVVFPGALPGIFTGLRIGMQFAWMSIVAAELIGAQDGLGHMIMRYKQYLIMDKVIAGMLVIGIAGFTLDRAIEWLRRRVVAWQVR